MESFKLNTKFKPAGDQPEAIRGLLDGLDKGYAEQTLLGVTGSGKTFTMANIIAAQKRPTLVMSHNKTLAAQLYGELRQFFPDTAVHYFVSYYDYYQPEAYIPHSDTYIEKEATVNEEIDRLRHAATQSLVSRRDVIIVASVSCIYGIGEKKDYEEMGRVFKAGEAVSRNEILRRLASIQYERNDIAFYRGQYRVKGDRIDIFLATGETVVRLELSGDRIEEIVLFSVRPGSGSPVWAADLRSKNGRKAAEAAVLPAKHFMTPQDRMKDALAAIRAELKDRLAELNARGKAVEAYRLERKTNFDLEMIEQVGYANGIENYSRHLSGRKAGEPPSTLIDFFPKDYLLFIDESHQTLPQIRGMYNGDRARKLTLVDFGFRLPSAIDNRPLSYAEFRKKAGQTIYVSATPGAYELGRSRRVAEQIIRPTGLLDPEVLVRPSRNQIADLIGEIEADAAKGRRVLVTTLTKRMAEELSEYLREKGVKVEYLHSDVETLDRVGILRDLRQGKYDVLVGINLLREGLDLPEVALVAILDADKSGFLRNETSLMQTMGRAARHAEGRVIMYADRMTPAIAFAVKETERRRKKQSAYNKKHGITPRTIQAKVHGDLRFA